MRKAVSINPERRHDPLPELVIDLSHPNPEFSSEHRLPLLERNPVAFWRFTTLLFALTTLSALIFK